MATSSDHSTRGNGLASIIPPKLTMHHTVPRGGIKPYAQQITFSISDFAHGMAYRQ